MYKLCKTEESIARQRNIENIFLDMLSYCHYDKITVSGLCKALGMSRKCFYRYFPTKKDLLISLIDHRLSDCNALVFSNWDGRSRIDKVALERFFTFWQGQTAFLDVSIKYNFWSLILERTTNIVDVMKQTSTEPRGASFARDQLEYFVSHGLMATVLRWHYFGYPSTPEDMAETFAAILSSSELSISRLLL